MQLGFDSTDPLRDRQLLPHPDRLASWPRRRRGTRGLTRAATDADQQPGARGDQRGRPPGADELPVLHHQGVRQRRAGVRLDLRSSSRASSSTTTPPAPSRAATRRARVLSSHDPPRRARLAGRATAARRRSRTPRCARPGWPAGATSCCRSRPSCSTRPCAALPARRLPRRQRRRSPTRRRRWRWPADAVRPRAGDRRRQHAHVRGDGTIARRQHRRPGADRGAAVLRRAAAPRWCSAPAAAPARRCGRCSTPARLRCASGTGPPSEPSSCAPSLAARPSRVADPADLLVNCTSGGLRARTRLSPSSPLARRAPVGNLAASSTSSTATPIRRSIGRCPRATGSGRRRA